MELVEVAWRWHTPASWTGRVWAMSPPRPSATSAHLLVVLAQVGVVALLALLWSGDSEPVVPGQVDWAFVGLLLGTPVLLVAASVLGAAVLARQPQRRSLM